LSAVRGWKPLGRAGRWKWNGALNLTLCLDAGKSHPGD
jgi:hypothetical protein